MSVMRKWPRMLGSPEGPAPDGPVTRRGGLVGHPQFYWIWKRDGDMREHRRLFPWWWRLWVGFGALVDGVITVGTLGLVTTAYSSDASMAMMKWGLRKLERERSSDEAVRIP